MGMKVWIASLEDSEEGLCPVGVFAHLERAQRECQEYLNRANEGAPEPAPTIKWVLNLGWDTMCFSWDSDEDRGSHWTFRVYQDEINTEVK
jgi:hypothetical protein